MSDDKKIEVNLGSVASTGGSKAGLIGGAIAAVVALIGIAFAAYKLWAAGRAKAKAEHALAVLKEKQEHEKVVAANALDEKRVQEALVEIDNLDKSVTLVEEQIALIEAKRLDAKKKIDDLSSWSDIDDQVVFRSDDGGSAGGTSSGPG